LYSNIFQCGDHVQWFGSTIWIYTNVKYGRLCASRSTIVSLSLYIYRERELGYD
jgi:hypothetical protein